MPWIDRARPIARRCALAAAVIVAVARPAAAQADVAALAMRTGEEWLGARTASAPAITGSRPLWQGQGAMTSEAQTAARVIRQWWPERIADADAAAMIDGYARYLQSRVIEQVFDLRYLRQAHNVESLPYFGGHVVWSVPTLRVSRQAVVARDRNAAVFLALEKWIGVPELQAAMFSVAHLPQPRLTGSDIVKTISDAAGQDVSWIFEAARSAMNYSIVSMSYSTLAECQCTETVVTVSRDGDGVFPGRADARSGDFDSGDALEVRVMFDGGAATSVRWDGRDRSRAFRFRGPSRPIAAYLDPGHVVTFDANRLDNAIVPPAATNVPVGKWVARWVVWLQHTIVSYGFLA
jgi:hypothetical protein